MEHILNLIEVDSSNSKIKVSITESTMMQILHRSMDKAYLKVKSKNGNLERLNEISKFYELAVIQLEGCLKLVQQETGSYDLDISQELLLEDLTEIKDRLQGRIKIVESAISEKDKELSERLGNELKLRKALETSEKRMDSLYADLEEQRKIEGFDELFLGRQASIETVDREDEFCELKHTVDQQVWNIQQQLEPNYQIQDEETNRGIDNKKIEQMGSDIGVLKETLDLAFCKMQNAIFVSELGPIEHQWMWNIERSISAIVIEGSLKGFRESFEEETKKRESQASCLRKHLSDVIREINCVNRELWFVCNPDEDQVKIPKPKGSPKGKCLSESNNLEKPSTTKQLGEEDSENDQVSLVAKMIKSHEYIIRKKSEEIDLATLREKSNPTSKKEKDSIDLKRRIQEIVMKLESLINLNHGIGDVFDDNHEQMKPPQVKSLTDDDRIDVEKSGVHSMEEIWAKVNKTSVYEPTNEDPWSEMKLLKQEIEDSNMQNMLTEEIYTTLFRCSIDEFHSMEEIWAKVNKISVYEPTNEDPWSEMKLLKQEIEDSNMQNMLTEEIYITLFRCSIDEFHSMEEIWARLNKISVYEPTNEDPWSKMKLLKQEIEDSNMQNMLTEEIYITLFRCSIDEFHSMEEIWARLNKISVYEPTNEDPWSEMKLLKQEIEDSNMQNMLTEEIYITLFRCSIDEFHSMEEIWAKVNKISVYEPTNEDPWSEMKLLKQEIEDSNMQNMLTEEIYITLFRCSIDEFHVMMLNQHIHCLIKEGMYENFITDMKTEWNERNGSEKYDTFFAKATIPDPDSAHNSIHADQTFRAPDHSKGTTENKNLVELDCPDYLFQALWNEIYAVLLQEILWKWNENIETFKSINTTNSELIKLQEIKVDESSSYDFELDDKFLETASMSIKDDVLKVSLADMIKDLHMRIYAFSLESFIKEDILLLVIVESMKQGCIREEIDDHTDRKPSPNNSMISIEDSRHTLDRLVKFFKDEEALILTAYSETKHQMMCLKYGFNKFDRNNRNSVDIKLEKALLQMDYGKALLNDLGSRLGITVNNLDPPIAIENCRKPSIDEAIETFIQGFSQMLQSFEFELFTRLGMHVSRLDEMKGELNLVAQINVSFIQKESLYRKAFTRRCESLHLAEAEEVLWEWNENIETIQSINTSNSALIKLQEIKVDESSNYDFESDDKFLETASMSIKDDVLQVFLANMIKDLHMRIYAFSLESFIKEDILLLVIVESMKQGCIREEIDDHTDRKPSPNNLMISIEDSRHTLDRLVKFFKDEEALILTAYSETKHQKMCLTYGFNEFDRNNRNSVDIKLEKALLQMDYGKALLNDLGSRLGITVNNLDPLIAIENCRKPSIDETIETFIQGFSQMLQSFEFESFTRLGMHVSRLDEMKGELNLVAQINVSLIQKESLYRKAFTRRCESLHLAEAEEVLWEGNENIETFKSINTSNSALIKLQEIKVDESSNYDFESDDKFLETASMSIKDDVLKVFLADMIKDLHMRIYAFSLESFIKEDILLLVIVESMKQGCIREEIDDHTDRKPSPNNLMISIEDSRHTLDRLVKFFKDEEALILTAYSETKHQKMCLTYGFNEFDQNNRNSVDIKLEKALLQMDYGKALLNDLGSRLGIVNNLDPLIANEICRKPSIDETIETFIQDVSQMLQSFEFESFTRLEMHVSRLDEMKGELNLVAQINISLIQKESLYRKAFTRRCESLQLAEAEVDILGDQVEQLISLLKKIYVKLHHHSPVLHHYFEISELLKQIEKEIGGR